MSNKNNTLSMPPTYNPSNIEEIRRVDYNTITQAARDWAKDNGIKPAASDKVKIAVLGIDMQNTFATPGGELFVDGAVGDSKRC
jgi:hypothetical protein